MFEGLILVPGPLFLVQRRSSGRSDRLLHGGCPLTDRTVRQERCRAVSR
jgi:hypothetical protein